MKTMKTLPAALAAIAVAALPSGLLAGTGWNLAAGGSQQFLDPANWDAGDINGIFPAEWGTGTDAADAVNLRLTNDWTGTIRFYGSIRQPVAFYGRSADDSKAQTRTITLNDDLVVEPALSLWTSSRLTFDSTIAIDLDGQSRTIRGSSVIGAKFRILGVVGNGSVVLDGNGGALALVENGRIDGDVDIRPNNTLTIEYPAENSTLDRAEDVTLHRGTFSVNAYKGTDTAVTGRLAADGSDAGAVSILRLGHSSHAAILSTESTVAENGGTLVILADAFGQGSDVTPRTQLLMRDQPTLIGGILPSVLAGATSAASNFGSGMGTLRFTTYDADRGVRAIGTDEMATAISDDDEVNLYVKAATVTLTSDAAVNSLLLDATAWGDASPTITGDATLAVRSGQILACAPNAGASIAATIDFGNVRGSVTAMGWHHRAVNITKPFHGSAGLVLAKALPMDFNITQGPSSGAQGIVVSGSSIADEGAYTGDTFVQCIVNVNSTPFLPHGTRSGNVTVNGCLSFGTIALNGLYGTGAVRGTALTIGEDGSDGDFSGTMVVPTVTKTGAGVQRLAGTATVNTALRANAGTLVVDGAVTGSANVADGAAIGGGGSISGALAFAEGARLAVAITEDGAPCLEVAGAVTGSAAVSVTESARVASGFEACVLRSGSAIAATFGHVAGYRLDLREGGTELWLTKNPSGTLVLLR